MYIVFIIVVSIALVLDFLLAFSFNKSRNLIARLLIILGTVLVAIILMPILNILGIGCIGQTSLGNLCDEEYKRISDPIVLYFLLFPIFMFFLKKVRHWIYILGLLFLIFLLIGHFFSLKPVLAPFSYFYR